jgi:protein O-mannosyl-transferase
MFWDDEDNILKNAYVHDWKYIGRYFTENVVAGRGIVSNYWRPVILLFWSIEWKFFNEWAGGYHFMHMLLHITNSVLLFYLLLKLVGKRYLALFVSIIFLIHPLQTEAITYVSGTSDPLSAMLIFLGLIVWVKDWGKPGKAKRLLILGGIYAALLMTRETAIVFPAYVAIVDFFLFLKDHPRGSLISFIKRNWMDWGALGALGILYLGLRATILNLDNTFNIYGQTTEFTSHFEYRLFTFFRVVSEYFELLFFPHDLHMERSVEIVKTLVDVRALVGLSIVLSSVSAAIYFLRKRPLITLGILWFWIGIFPISNVAIPVNGLMYEHWLYIPLVGIFLSLLSSFELLVKSKKVKNIAIAGLLIWFLFLSFVTIKRNFEWKDPITFYNQTLKYSPNSYRIINNLGMAYADNKQQTQAIEKYTQAITLDPQNAVSYHNLGNTYRELGQKDKAIESFNKAISLNPEFFFSYNALTSLYLSEGDNLMAQGTMLRYLEVSPDKFSVYTTLAQIAYQGKDYKNAIFYLQKLLEIDPTNVQIKQTISQLENIQNQK